MSKEQEIADLKRRLDLPSLPESAKDKLRQKIAELEASASTQEDDKSAEIENLKRRLELPSLPESAKNKLREKITELEGKSEKPAEKKQEKEPKIKFVKKKSEKAEKEPPKKRGRKPKAEKKEESQETKIPKKRGRKPKKKDGEGSSARPKKVYKPKVKSSNEEPDCDTLIKKWKERREKAKLAGKKRKTKPVFRKIAGDVVDAVEKAIKNVPKETLKESPKVMIRKFGTLQKAADGFLKAFRDILGKDYDVNQSQAEIAELNKLIEKLTKKYSVK